MSSCVDFWLGRLQPVTVKNCRVIMNNFMAWLAENGGSFKDYDPDLLVGFQRRAVGEHRYLILDLIQRYVSGRPNLRISSKMQYYAFLRSFFLHNRVELPKDRTFKVSSDIPAVVGTLSLDELRRIVDSSNLCYKTIFLCMFMGGMGLGELVYWSDHGLASTRKQLDTGDSVIRVDLPGRKKFKNRRPFYTFIGGDGLQCLRAYMDERPHEPYIFANQYGDPISKRSIQKYFIYRLRRLGLIPQKSNYVGTRYGKNPHEIRDLFRTRWQKSGRAREVAEFMMGHTVDPLGYNKALSDEHYARREFKGALKWLNIMSMTPEYMHVDDVEDFKVELKNEIMQEIMRTLRHNAEIINE